jgi:hypothetical protein
MKMLDFVTLVNIVYFFPYVIYNSYLVLNYDVDDDTMTRHFTITSIILIILLGWWIVS